MRRAVAASSLTGTCSPRHSESQGPLLVSSNYLSGMIRLVNDWLLSEDNKSCRFPECFPTALRLLSPTIGYFVKEVLACFCKEFCQLYCV
jgi:hypothetical protein